MSSTRAAQGSSLRSRVLSLASWGVGFSGLFATNGSFRKIGDPNIVP